MQIVHTSVYSKNTRFRLCPGSSGPCQNLGHLVSRSRSQATLACSNISSCSSLASLKCHVLSQVRDGSFSCCLELLPVWRPLPSSRQQFMPTCVILLLLPMERPANPTIPSPTLSTMAASKPLAMSSQTETVVIKEMETFRQQQHMRKRSSNNIRGCYRWMLGTSSRLPLAPSSSSLLLEEASVVVLSWCRCLSWYQVCRKNKKLHGNTLRCLHLARVRCARGVYASTPVISHQKIRLHASR